MNKNFGLSYTEKEIMELLWQSGEPLSFREILDYANDTWKKNWKKQTLNTYLLNMQKAGLIGSERGKVYQVYFPLLTREEHIHNWTRKMVKETFGGSVYSLVAAFTGGERQSEEGAAQLSKMF